jgi:hypothetical protein
MSDVDLNVLRATYSKKWRFRSDKVFAGEYLTCVSAILGVEGNRRIGLSESEPD